MKITIDGKEVVVTKVDSNIVDVAAEAGIGIPAPCYKNSKKYGCCYACVIEIDNEQKYACNTKPVEGMNVTVNKEELKKIRKERLKNYREKKSEVNKSSCDCSTNSECP